MTEIIEENRRPTLWETCIEFAKKKGYKLSSNKNNDGYGIEGDVILKYKHLSYVISKTNEERREMTKIDEENQDLPSIFVDILERDVKNFHNLKDCLCTAKYDKRVSKRLTPQELGELLTGSSKKVNELMGFGSEEIDNE
jgi:hypothetical protein